MCSSAKKVIGLNQRRSQDRSCDYTQSSSATVSIPAPLPSSLVVGKNFVLSSAFEAQWRTTLTSAVHEAAALQPACSSTATASSTVKNGNPLAPWLDLTIISRDAYAIPRTISVGERLLHASDELPKGWMLKKETELQLQGQGSDASGQTYDIDDTDTPMSVSDSVDKERRRKPQLLIRLVLIRKRPR